MPSYKNRLVKQLLEIHQEASHDQFKKLSKAIEKHTNVKGVAFDVTPEDNLDEILRKYRVRVDDPRLIKLDKKQEDIEKDFASRENFIVKYQKNFQKKTGKDYDIRKWPLDLLAAQAYEHNLNANITLFSFQLLQAVEPPAMWHEDFIFLNEIRLICYGIANAAIYKSLGDIDYEPTSDVELVIDKIFNESEKQLFPKGDYGKAIKAIAQYFDGAVNYEEKTKIGVLNGNKCRLAYVLNLIHKKLKNDRNVDTTFVKFAISTFRCFDDGDIDLADFYHCRFYKNATDSSNK